MTMISWHDIRECRISEVACSGGCAVALCEGSSHAAKKENDLDNLYPIVNVSA